MTSNYRVGIIGAGWVAGEYYKCFAEHPQTEIVGVYNRTQAKAANLLKKNGLSAKIHDTAEDLIDNGGADIIVTTTTPDVRPAYVIRAAERGCHVVIEKPVALTMKETKEMLAAVEKAGVKTVTSFVLRWNEQFETTKKLIADGVLGKIMYAEVDYWHPLHPDLPLYPWIVGKRQGGSAFVAGGCHGADAIRFFVGEVAEVSAYSRSSDTNPDFEYDPIVVASMRFENGAVGKLSAIMEADTPYIFNTQLFGTEGTVRNNSVYSSVHYPGATGYFQYPTINPDSGDVSHHPFPGEINHFIECLDEDVESHASIHDSAKTMALCFAIDKSAASGGHPVKVKDVWNED